MHGYRIGTCEYRACLPVFSLAIAEEKGIVGGKEVTEVTCLPDEAADECGAIGDAGSRGNDEIFGDHIVPDGDGGFRATVNGAVFEP